MREDLTEVVAVCGAGRGTKGARNADCRIKLRLGDADLCTLCQRGKLGCSNIGAATK